MRIDAALIAGTGLGQPIAELPGQAMFVPTNYGLVKGKLVQREGSVIFCIQRHSRGHTLPPHGIKYLAMAAALRFVKAKGCISSAAVGSLNPAWQAGQLVLCSDFIDLSGRNLTLFETTVGHKDLTQPFDPTVNKLLQSLAEVNAIGLQAGGVYANTNGPRYETPAEIEAINRLGGNLVGMTAGSEAIAMRECDIPYSCVAVVTNAAAGMGDLELSHFDVGEVMKKRGTDLLNLMLDVAARVGGS